MRIGGPHEMKILSQIDAYDENAVTEEQRAQPYEGPPAAAIGSGQPPSGSKVTTRAFDRHRGGGHPPTPATPPCIRVRTRRFELVTLALIDQRWMSKRFEVSIIKPTERALARASYQGPSPLPSVLLASRGRAPSASRSARRRRGVFHCRHIAARGRSRTQQVS